MAEKNDAQKRIQDDFEPTFPGDDIICKDCGFKKPGIIGFKNRYCKVYTPEIRGKPNEILFENAKCEYYRNEEKDAE